MRVAAIQMNSGSDVPANLELADGLLADAAADGCRLVAMPENFALMPEHGCDKARYAEEPGNGPIQTFLSEAAARHRLWIVAGSMPLISPAIADERVYGACPVYDDRGVQRAIYRKIHLFDVDLVDKGESYRESNSMYSGDEVVAVDTPAGRLGLTICYDLRFPELFRRVLAEQAEGNAVVSAEIDPGMPTKLRSEFPALSNRRLR
jgi:predicted amidohydrolase